MPLCRKFLLQQFKNLWSYKASGLEVVYYDDKPIFAARLLPIRSFEQLIKIK